MALDTPEPGPDPAPTAPLGELRFHRLLVAIDGSGSAELALSAAVTAARRDHATLTLLVVVPNVTAESGRWITGGAPDPRTLQEDADAFAQKTLRHAIARLPDDLSVTSVVRRGKPGPEIVAQSAADTYDAILLGARGLGRVGLLTGSVSSYVLHHATIPVFVAHAPPE